MLMLNFCKRVKVILVLFINDDMKTCLIYLFNKAIELYINEKLC